MEPVRALLICSAGIVAWAGFNPVAHALLFQLGEEASLDIDTSLTYAAQWRVEDQSNARMRPDITGVDGLAAGRKLFEGANNDDGNRNFDRGLVSNKLTAVVDLDFSWRNVGVFLRGRAYYDTVYMNEDTDMDEFGYQTYNSGFGPCCFGGNISGDTALGDFPDGTIETHGRRVELLDAFFYGTFDIVGDRVLDLRMGSQVINWGETTIAPGINGLQNRFDQIAGNTAGAELKEIFLPTGAIYGQVDLTASLTFEAYYQYEWIETRLNGVGSYFGGTLTPDFLGPGAQNMLISFGTYNPDGSINIGASVPRTGDIEPSDQGQWGAAFHYMTEGGTDLGFYAINGHDKSPSVIRNGGILPTNYTVRYFDDIRGYAASFTSVWGKANVQGEVTYFSNTPIADADGVAERMGVTKLNLGGTYVVTPTRFWDDLNILFEFAGVFANGKTDKEMQFDADAWAVSLRAEAAYNNVLQGLDLKVPVFYQQTLHGSFRGASASYVDRAKVLSIGLQGIYLNKWISQLTYTTYFDGGIENLIIDRDNIALSLKYAF
jgi:hypothetical protein